MHNEPRDDKGTTRVRHFSLGPQRGLAEGAKHFESLPRMRQIRRSGRELHSGNLAE